MHKNFKVSYKMTEPLMPIETRHGLCELIEYKVDEEGDLREIVLMILD